MKRKEKGTEKEKKRKERGKEMEWKRTGKGTGKEERGDDEKRWNSAGSC